MEGVYGHVPAASIKICTYLCFLASRILIY